MCNDRAMNRRLLVAMLSLVGCTTPAPVDAQGTTWLRLGQTATVDGPRVTPLSVLEDSRCPINARCVWAGRVRLSIRVTLGDGPHLMEIETIKPLQVADGTLELVDVQPGQEVGEGKKLKPADYRARMG